MEINLTKSIVERIRKKDASVAGISRENNWDYGQLYRTLKRKTGMRLHKKKRKVFSPASGGSIPRYRIFFNRKHGSGAWQALAREAKKFTEAQMGERRVITRARIGQILKNLGIKKKKIFAKRPLPFKRKELSAAIKKQYTQVGIAKELNVSAHTLLATARRLKVKLPSGLGRLRSPVTKEEILEKAKNCLTVWDLWENHNMAYGTVRRRFTDPEWEKLKKQLKKRRKTLGGNP